MTKFGIGQIGNSTPKWAKWTFRVYFLVSKIIIGYLSASDIVSKEHVDALTKIVVLLIDPLIYGFSKMFGIEIENSEEASQENSKSVE